MLGRIVVSALLAFSLNAFSATVVYRDGVDILVDGVNTGVNFNGTHDAELRSSASGANFDTGSAGSGADTQFTVCLLYTSPSPRDPE